MFIILILNPCKAQVPGFIGRKFVVSGGMMFSPAFYSTYKTHKNTGDNSVIPFGVNLVKNVQVDYTISRENTIGLEYQNLRSCSFVLRDFYIPSTGKKTTVRDVRYVYMNSVGINIKKFNIEKGAIAPIGDYQKFAFNAVFCRSYDSLDNIEKLYPTKNKFLTFTYGIGSSRVLYKNITLNYGVDLTVMFDRRFFSFFPKKPNSVLYSDASFYRVKAVKVFNSFVSLGYVF